MGFDKEVIDTNYLKEHYWAEEFISWLGIEKQVEDKDILTVVMAGVLLKLVIEQYLKGFSMDELFDRCIHKDFRSEASEIRLVDIASYWSNDFIDVFNERLINLGYDKHITYDDVHNLVREWGF